MTGQWSRIPQGTLMAINMAQAAVAEMVSDDTEVLHIDIKPGEVREGSAQYPSEKPEKLRTFEVRGEILDFCAASSAEPFTARCTIHVVDEMWSPKSVTITIAGSMMSYVFEKEDGKTVMKAE